MKRLVLVALVLAGCGSLSETQPTLAVLEQTAAQTAQAARAAVQATEGLITPPDAEWKAREALRAAEAAQDALKAARAAAGTTYRVTLPAAGGIIDDRKEGDPQLIPVQYRGGPVPTVEICRNSDGSECR